jgi:D-lactate dehydrogenase
MSDRMLQWVSERLPDHLPARLNAYRAQYEHHLMLKVPAAGIEEARAFLAQRFANGGGAYFECTDEEGRKAFLHRFAAASAAVRYRAVHHREVEDIVALDIALRRNDRDWYERLPEKIERPIILKLYYGHFLCHVFHQDYIVAKGNDCMALEHEMLALLDERGAEYPAEHNVGHLYEAKPQLAAFYKQLDPCNCFNPGIGKTSKFAAYREHAQA